MSHFGRNIRESYDRVAVDYAAQFADELNRKPFDRDLLDHFAGLVRRRGMVCDVGCGPGHVGRYLHEAGLPVCGVDLSGRLLAEGRRLNPAMSFTQGDMLALPLANESLVGIIAFYSIIHLHRERLPQALAEMQRVLTAGGWLLMAFHDGEGETRADEWFGKPVALSASFFQPNEIQAALEAAGLAVSRVQVRDPYEFESTRQVYILAQKLAQPRRYFAAPARYDCPFCKVASGDGDAITRPSDIVYRDEFTTAFISPKWWPNNPGYVIIIPNGHYEDLFDLPAEVAAHVHRTAQKIARAFMELYECDGISTRQHNGIYPMQEVWHYHFHIFPRFKDDRLYALDDESYGTTPDQRLPYAEKLRVYLKQDLST